MQILYWYLTRPQTSTCGGSVSPPLLQRRDGTGTSARSNLPLHSIFDQLSDPVGIVSHQIRTSSLSKAGDAGYLNQSKRKIMEHGREDQTPTFYLLNAVDLPDDEDSALNHHLELIHQNDHDGTYNGQLVAIGNGPCASVGSSNVPQRNHYADPSLKIVPSKRKKRRSNELAKVLCIEDVSDDESFVNIGPSKSKKAKLVVNLYPEDKGYSFGYQLPGSSECSESHAIPYSERYLLDSIDAQQIPHKMLCKLEDKQGVNLMRYRNQVIAEIRDYRRFMHLSNSQVHTSSSSRSMPVPSNNTFTTNVNGNAAVNDKHNPIVKQVMLRPTTESLLCDFDMIVEKALQDKGDWNSLQRQNGDNCITTLTDGSDSEFEYEVDIASSRRTQCNYLTYDQRLELEKNFVNQTAAPLCLDPSPQVGIITNCIQYEKFKWNTQELKNAAKRWAENPFKSNQIIQVSQSANAHVASVAEGRLNLEPFYSFVMGVRAKSLSSRTSILDKDALRLPPISYQDYPNVDPPKNMEEVLRIGQPAEPAQIRLFSNENSVRKIEEYILETERRKRPHTTTLSIFQRNGMESYFGELEMESFLDPNQPKFGTTAPASTKCQFELGSSKNVTLYVKQFSDIFTEDGRRPCKITYQKVGHPPQIVYTNSYKSSNPTPPIALSSIAPSTQTITAVTATIPQVGATITSPAVVHAVASVSGPTIITSANSTASSNSVVQPLTTLSSITTAPSPASNVTGMVTQIQRPSTTSSVATAVVVTANPNSTTATPSLPPVQIVHPQPRTTPQQQKAQAAGQRPATIQIFSQQNQAQSITVPQSPSSSANVNLNVNLNSSGITPQQVLTRPHIVNVSLQQQQQQQTAAQQQLLQLTQQRILRMKQQQPSTALAKLLLTNIQTKPITVAVQPTPQNPTNISGTNSSPICSNSGSPASVSCSPSSTSNTTNANNTCAGSVALASPEHTPQQNPLGSPLMISSPPSVSSAMTNTSSNVSVNVNASNNVSLNLNTISLDGLLSVSSANVNYSNTATLSTNQASGNLVATPSVNLGLSRLATSGSPAVNILRLNNTAGTAMTTGTGGNTVQLATVQRQLAVSNALNGNVSILQQGSSQPQQRILINANSVNNLNLSSVGSSDIEELSVPDLQTLLGGQPIQISQLAQQQHIIANASAPTPSQTTIDTTNLNLNLNVNLNSGTVVNNGDSQVQQHQITKIQGGEWTTTAQAPPFLVFISPLRPMITTPGSTSGTGSVSNPSTLSLNLGAVQTTQLQQAHQISQSPSTKEPPTRILLGTCNNGVAIKREPIQTSTTTAIASSGHNDTVASNPGEHQLHTDRHAIESQQVVSSSDVVVDGVDSLFNALSKAIGPEQLKKLDASLTTGSTTSSSVTSSQNSSSVVESVANGMRIIAPCSTVNMTASSNSLSTTVSTISNKTNSTNVITLSDLLGSPTVVSSSTGNTSSFPSLILSSGSSHITSSGNSMTASSNTISSSPTLSSLLNSVTTPTSGVVGGLPASSAPSTPSTPSNIVSQTPRLSALLAGTPSADTLVVGTNGPPAVLTQAGTPDSSTGMPTAAPHYGTLLDRLAASLNQPQGTSGQGRSGTSRLNPIASATPSVVLEHPVLAATLTQQQSPQPSSSPTAVPGGNRGSTYRQIAPAPSPVSNMNTTTTSSIGSSGVAVISSSDVQSHIQSPQLINLLGLVGNNANATGAGQTRTIRISASSASSNPSPGSASR